jgi:hypothetical protein
MLYPCTCFPEAGCDESGRGEVARGRSRRLVRGSVYRYQCEEGAVLRGSELAFCDGERWSSDPPTCIGKETSVILFYINLLEEFLAFLTYSDSLMKVHHYPVKCFKKIPDRN